LNQSIRASQARIESVRLRRSPTAGARRLKARFSREAAPVEVESVQGQCEEVLSQMSHDYFPEVKDNRKCEQVSVSGQPLLLRATKEFMQENGWPFPPLRSK